MSSPTFENLRDTRQSPAGHILQPQSVGKYVEILKAMLGPSAYETGGVTLNASDCQLTYFNWVEVDPALSGDRLALVIYPTNQGINKTVKIMFTDLAGTEIGNGVDLSAKKFRLRAQGTY